MCLLLTYCCKTCNCAIKTHVSFHHVCTTPGMQLQHIPGCFCVLFQHTTFCSVACYSVAFLWIIPSNQTDSCCRNIKTHMWGYSTESNSWSGSHCVTCRTMQERSFHGCSALITFLSCNPQGIYTCSYNTFVIPSDSPQYYPLLNANLL